MEALFIGQSYIDVTFLTDEIPTGDEKAVARDYSISFGGNAVTAAFCCAKLGVAPDLLASVADDWLGRMFIDMAAKYGISVHHRKVQESSLSFVMPKGGQRAIVRCRDDHYLHPFPPLNLRGCRALHVDGHQADAAIHYAKACREAGILTSLDGGGLRSNTHELLDFIDVAVVAERLCEQMHMTVERDAELSALARLQGRRRDARRARARLVRGEWRGPRTAGAERAAGARHRHQRRRRHFPRRLRLLVSDQQGRELGRSFPLRARGVGPFDPASRQRGEPADARRYCLGPGALWRTAR